MWRPVTHFGIFQELELELNEFKSTSETLSEKLVQLEVRTSDLEKVKIGLESELQSLRVESEKKLNDLVIVKYLSIMFEL